MQREGNCTSNMAPDTDVIVGVSPQLSSACGHSLAKSLRGSFALMSVVNFTV